MKSQASSKYLKMVLLSYGVNGEDYIEEKIETFHSNIHSLLFKLKKPTIWRNYLQIILAPKCDNITMTFLQVNKMFGQLYLLFLGQSI